MSSHFGWSSQDFVDIPSGLLRSDLKLLGTHAPEMLMAECPIVGLSNIPILISLNSTSAACSTR